ncbi:VPLPA-CTERM sorting domain-containing protein [Rhodovulum sulfidophilum]|uniref:VPLPA-CTERM sorting domain-containing protein n=1 Tax=Rhodovulum sulfidophilum TaxID=35806 RepID=UPI001928FEC7|nr:VPLPA-CTERM sorting domain-containing protein [Rhodovulum sulfidophilum]MBL3586455.1 VPLPA-CTERM sorting domain-containing protein [Rhodovulum sulfidophilum]
MRILKTLAASAALALSAGALHASTLSFAGGTGYNVAFGSGNYRGGGCTGDKTACYDPSGSAGALTEDLRAFDDDNHGPGLLLSRAARLTVTFLGKEANSLNWAFTVAGGMIDSSEGVGASYSAIVNAGTLDFTFGSVAGGGALAGNDGSFIGSAAIAFSKIYGNKVYAYFDNSGAKDDRDFDDMVVEISIAPIPLPAGALLLGTALGGLGLARRRKAAKA